MKGMRHFRYERSGVRTIVRPLRFFGPAEAHERGWVRTSTKNPAEWRRFRLNGRSTPRHMRTVVRDNQLFPSANVGFCRGASGYIIVSLFLPGRDTLAAMPPR